MGFKQVWNDYVKKKHFEPNLNAKYEHLKSHMKIKYTKLTDAAKSVFSKAEKSSHSKKSPAKSPAKLSSETSEIINTVNSEIPKDAPPPHVSDPSLILSSEKTILTVPANSASNSPSNSSDMGKNSWSAIVSAINPQPDLSSSPNIAALKINSPRVKPQDTDLSEKWSEDPKSPISEISPEPIAPISLSTSSDLLEAEGDKQSPELPLPLKKSNSARSKKSKNAKQNSELGATSSRTSEAGKVKPIIKNPVLRPNLSITIPEMNAEEVQESSVLPSFSEALAASSVDISFEASASCMTQSTIDADLFPSPALHCDTGSKVESIPTSPSLNPTSLTSILDSTLEEKKKDFQKRSETLFKGLDEKNLNKTEHFKLCLALLDEYLQSKEFAFSIPKEAVYVRKQLKAHYDEYPKNESVLNNIALSTLQLLLYPNKKKVEHYKQLGLTLAKANPYSNSAQALCAAIFLLGAVLIALGASICLGAVGLGMSTGVGGLTMGTTLAGLGGITFFNNSKKNAHHQKNSEVLQKEMDGLRGKALSISYPELKLN